MAAENAYKYDYGYGYAPQREPVALPEQENKPELKKVKKRKIDLLKQQERATNLKLLKIASVLCVFFALYAVVCNSFAMRADAKQNLEAVKEQYVFAEAQNRELKVQLNNLISTNNIDRIAVEKLGLVKVAAGSEIYLDTSEGNQVIFSGDK